MVNKFYTIQEHDIGRDSIFAFGKQWAVNDITPEDVGKRVYQMHGALHWEQEIPFQVIELPAKTDDGESYDDYGVFSYYSNGARVFHGLFGSVESAQLCHPHAEWHGPDRTGYVPA